MRSTWTRAYLNGRIQNVLRDPSKILPSEAHEKRQDLSHLPCRCSPFLSTEREALCNRARRRFSNKPSKSLENPMEENSYFPGFRVPRADKAPRRGDLTIAQHE